MSQTKSSLQKQLSYWQEHTSCLHDVIAQQAEQTPETCAIVFEGEQLTYRQLNQRANQLAHYLQKLGVGPEVRVGLCMQRSLEVIVGILGILKAGGAYIPLDPLYPQERLAFILDDAQVTTLLTQQSLLASLPKRQQTHFVCIDTMWEEVGREQVENPQSGTVATNLMYVIYTSGSTGQPKGVCCSHVGVLNLLDDFERRQALSIGDCASLWTSLSFDVSVYEIFSPLLTGGTLHIVPEHIRPEGKTFIEWLSTQHISSAYIPPFMLVDLLNALQEGQRFSLRRLLVGVEVIPASLLAEIQTYLPALHIINGYGPTETSICATLYSVTPTVTQHRNVPMGKAVQNLQLHVLDTHLQAVPPGEPGELYIGGAGLARGYLNRPDLTAERFIPHPFSQQPGARLYKTGDIVRSLPDGTLEFSGRRDAQVKIRGFRIELGEIETLLVEHEAVREAVVLAREDAPGNKRLVAYVVPQGDQKLSFDELRSYMKSRVPDYMVPTVFMLLEALPLTPSGKINRRALPGPVEADLQRAGPFVAPRTSMESLLADIWADVLGVERVSITDNFFDLGGHSLLATQVIARIRIAAQRELPLSALFKTPVLADLAALLEESQQSQQQHIFPVPRTAHTYLPLSFAQERVWFLQQLDPDNRSYNFQATLRLTGILDIPVLEQSLSEIISRHEIFRTTFEDSDGRPVQIIHPAQPVQIPLHDLQHIPVYQHELEAQRLIAEECQHPFTIAQLPLIRWVLLRLDEQEHILVHIEHHLVHDGWSFNVFLRELADLYCAFAAGEASPLPALPVQFADFALWQREWVHSEEAQQQLAYWQQKLAGSPPLLALPTDYPRPAVQTSHGAAPRIELPLALCAALRRMSRQEGSTLYMTMFAAFLTLLYRYSGQEDMCVGSSIANRRWRETEGLLGMLLNTTVLRADLSHNPTFEELLSRVRTLMLEAYEHQDFPFDKIVEALNPERNLSYNPLFQIMFGFHDSPLSTFKIPNLTVNLTEGISNGSAKFDMNIVVIPRAEQHTGSHHEQAAQEGITLVWEYNTDLFDAATIRRMVGHYQTLLEAIVVNPRLHLSDVPLLTAEEYQQLAGWNETATDYPRQQSIASLFEMQVEQTPAATAVLFKDMRVTYQELNSRANQLAHHLQRLGVGPEILVGVYMERSLDLIIALLGILKAGGAYLPLDIAYPKERIAFMLQDTQTPVLLTQQHLVERLPTHQAQFLCLDTQIQDIAQESTHNVQQHNSPENLAYVIYTSGSTGVPKGVAVTQRNVVRLVKETNYVSLDAGQVFLQFASISFDAATFEIWGSLLNGAKLVVFPPYKPSLQELGQVLRQQRITTLWLTAGLFHQMVEERLADLTTVRQLLAGGDVLSVPHVQKVLRELPECVLINGYGPTENTTFVTCYPLRADADRQLRTSVPIGYPIANTTACILDAHLQLVPVGVPGELYAGGDGVARGYLQRPELTAERFIPHPFSKSAGERLYKTGDSARYLADGAIEFLGRRDSQVKIRGFRVEPGEIEAALVQHPLIRECVVVVREDSPGDKRLVAYLVANAQSSPASNELRSFLKETLPDYMLPSAFVYLDVFPLTPQGKVDRRALPAPESNALAQGSLDEAPRTLEEEALAKIWQDVLHVEHVSIFANFFELGGHSLLATQVISRIRQTFQRELPLRSLFEKPTVAELALAIMQAPGEQKDRALDTPIHLVSRGDREQQLLAQLDILSDEEVASLLSGMIDESL
ncbi:MAG: amino acid adenylation domain-containing protein [Ktedonobacteraceae bacterium]